MKDSPLTIQQVLRLLAVAPRRIAALTIGLVPSQLVTAPAPGEWSANQVLAHLRACADVRGGCILAMLAQDRPTLRAINPRAWIKKTDYLELDFQPSLDAFTAQRAALLAVLEPLAPEGWLRMADVKDARAVHQRSVLFYGQWLASHEQVHLEQVSQIVTTLRMP